VLSFGTATQKTTSAPFELKIDALAPLSMLISSIFFPIRFEISDKTAVLKPVGVPSAEIRTRVDEALAAVGMTEYAKHAPHKLSGGQKQRIAIAGIIAMLPKCIIFDESTAMLDPLGREELMSAIEKLNREKGITVIHITHYMNEAARADRIIVFDDGEVLLDGKPKDVFSDPERLRAVGLDVPQTVELLWKLNLMGADFDQRLIGDEECAKAIADAVSAINK